MSRTDHVVIVGGGFSGTALAVQLLREEAAPVTVTIVEGREALGKGLAYGTRDACHLLNTTNGGSSALDDDSDHFQRWLESSGCPAAADQYSARQKYARYLQHTLDDAAARAASWGSLMGSRLGRRATDIEIRGAGFRLSLDDGELIDCTQVVLATGYAPPADPLADWLSVDNRNYLRNPWNGPLPAEIARTDSVLLVGTGLTMVDVALSLQRRGHRGTLHAISRRGLLRAARQTVAEAQLAGISWQAVVDALRPLSSGIWGAMSEPDQRRFLRHLRPYYEAHRHRISQEPAATLASMLADGRLQLRAGRIVGASDCGDMILVKQQLRGTSKISSQPYRWIINCTGATIRAAGQSLESRLITKGLLVADENGLGYQCDGAGVVRGAQGAVPGLYMIGPACRADSYEHTAIPELRRQAADLARLIAQRKARIASTSWMPSTVMTCPLHTPPWRGIAKQPSYLT